MKRFFGRKALSYKKHENKTDRKSYTCAPLKVPKCDIFDC
jgi:hypothetical protein